VSVFLKWQGLAELRDELGKLPDEVVAEAREITRATTELAKGEIVGQYEAHRVTGNLAKGVIVSPWNKGQDAPGYKIKSTAPHAWLFENGTQVRHNALGANRGEVQPPANVFVPVVIRRRREMYEQLKAMIARKGLKVSGDV